MQEQGDTPTLTTDQASAVLKALADATRQRILLQLKSGERCVCDLTGDLNLAQSKLSFHLRVLKDAGLVADRQSGRWIYYRLQPQTIVTLENWLIDLRRNCETAAAPCTN
ncbi:MAG: metalloregulator ArsR/SmtB family transcription factor [Cyanobacteria bacterium]|jgi:ArsR family transcriptional regulator|nr:transcriptional regulator [Cyanobium sp. MED843]MDA0257506.1 metalloregulator ArsR/SmtB family transcription factor [Cyanobacteriota bacterium]OUW30556.1 MAG: transcriptional regulator [Cyanobacteria bacterium TMED177]